MRSQQAGCRQRRRGTADGGAAAGTTPASVPASPLAHPAALLHCTDSRDCCCCALLLLAACSWRCAAARCPPRACRMQQAAFRRPKLRGERSALSELCAGGGKSLFLGGCAFLDKLPVNLIVCRATQAYACTLISLACCGMLRPSFTGCCFFRPAAIAKYLRKLRAAMQQAYRIRKAGTCHLHHLPPHALKCTLHLCWHWLSFRSSSPCNLSQR